MKYEIKACKTKAACSVKPLEKVKMDFGKIKEEFEVVLDNPIALVITVDGEEIVVHNYGEMLFKTLKDENRIKNIADRIYGVGL